MASGQSAAAGRPVDAAGGRRNHRGVQGLGPNSPRDRGGRMRRGPNRRQQQGVALLIALVLVALATILATKLTFDGYIERRRAIGILAAEQAIQFGLGAEALAGDALTQTAQSGGGGQQFTLSQAWAQPTVPMPITPQDDPEGEIGRV